jgi:hypothetical protein
MGVILSFPVISYFYIIHNNIGLRENIDNTEHKYDIAGENIDNNDFNNNFLSKKFENENEIEINFENGNFENEKKIEYKKFENEKFRHNISNPLLFNSEYNILPNGVNNDQISNINENNINNDDDTDNDINNNIKNNKYKLEYKFFIKILPICLAVGYVNFNTWGMVTALSPFAFKNVTKNQESASVFLSLAYQLSSVLLVFGEYIYIYIYIYTYIHMCICSHVCVHIYMNCPSYLYKYIHLYIFIYE